MRCKNCGWENPTGNTQCGKCNAPLNNFMNDEDYQTGEDRPSGEYNPRPTSRGCLGCGFPIRPDAEECPNCGVGITRISEKEASPKRKSMVHSTIIVGEDDERRKLVAFLVTYSHSPNGTFYPLFEGKNIIGKSSSSHVCIHEDQRVSDIHLSILYRDVDKKFKFKDEQSTNGTYVNEELKDEGVLTSLDSIRIGKTKLIFIAIPETAIEK